MNVGELFVELGINGTEKTVGALTSVRKGLGDLSSMSIEAKAGILAALYGLERLTAASGAMGTNLTNFTALTGMSAKALQQWQYAARQAGVSGQEMEGSLKGVQNAMTNMLQGKGMPEGFGQVAAKVGLDPTKLRDTTYVLQQLQKYAQSVPADLARTVIGTFGVGEGVISGMRRNMFRGDVFAKAPTYSDKEVGALDKANIAWSNLGNKIEMAIGHFNAKHGGQLVKDISMITDKVIKLTEEFLKLAEVLKLFKVLGTVFEGWANLFGVATEEAKTAVGLLDPKTREKSESKISDFLGAVPGAFKLMGQDFVSGQMGNNIINGLNLYFNHDGKNAAQTANDVQKAVKDAHRKMPTNKGGH